MAAYNLASFYPPTWPANPFHAGEVQVQKKLGVQSHVMSYAPKVVRPYLPDQHRQFFATQPFLVVAARDDRDRLWSTLLFASDPNNVTSFVTSPDPTILSIDSLPLPGDALEGALKIGSDLGILGIEFAARRRNRVNGRLVASGSNVLQFKVDQSFGNCPQYIKPRDWWTSADSQANANGSKDDSASSSVQRSTRLSSTQIVHIQHAETIFVATGYRGEGEDPRFGNDASHRGGAAGFLQVHEESNKLYLPDYPGNNHYNTLGNMIIDPRMGITIPLYETGGMIQLTGTAIVDWDEEAAGAKFLGAKRVIQFTIDEVVELPAGSLPIRWASDDKARVQVQVAEKIYESENVASFYLAPLQGDAPSLPAFEPGQHLPIALPTSPNEVIVRTYSLSASNSNNEYYRISVKKEPFGLASRFLHDQVQVGDVLTIQKPAGHFAYDQSSERTTLVLLSSGIGVTPVLSMLHKFVEDSTSSKKKAFWIHGARDGKHHPFQSEVETLKKLAGDRLQTHIAYSKPSEKDSSYDYEGRITVELLHDLVSDLGNADIYMCGPAGFMADMEIGFELLGVDSKQIHFESF
jgi:ferredoxin-NADP reductase/predicted pyridoxine 5'-phosphate oxidase superfamily flavin-nucleotide-binding protein